MKTSMTSKTQEEEADPLNPKARTSRPSPSEGSIRIIPIMTVPDMGMSLGMGMGIRLIEIEMVEMVVVGMETVEVEAVMEV